MSDETHPLSDVRPTGTTDDGEGKEPEKGENVRTKRDMDAVTEHVEERSAIDLQTIERAIDKLVKIREVDLQKPADKLQAQPKIALSAADVKYFMEKCSASKADAEKFLQDSAGSLPGALVAWIKSPTGLDYDSLYPSPHQASQSFV